MTGLVIEPTTRYRSLLQLHPALIILLHNSASSVRPNPRTTTRTHQKNL